MGRLQFPQAAMEAANGKGAFGYWTECARIRILGISDS
uniref:Uncharacterized protein n=1 Tax=Anguilla anguilla TaxID=7936 RepID=A0A0E9QRR5_ANGAN